MEIQYLHIAAGVVSSLLFISSNFPMLLKAHKTKNLQSYSLSNIALGNFGNLIHWVYVSSLPFGPIWFLHGFFTVTMALMLLWYLRYEIGCAVSDLTLRCISDLSECQST